jgi:hypothetical protein
MAMQRLLIGTVVGGIVLTLFGYLVFGYLTIDFFAANAGTATGVAKMPFNFVALVIGQLAWAAMLTMILRWASVRSIGQGVMVAGLSGLLIFLGVDLTFYATQNVQNLTATLADPVLSAIVFAVAGGAIAAVGGIGKPMEQGRALV